MLKTLTGDLSFLAAKKIFDSYQRQFDDYVNARNTFEHFEDRLPGGRKELSVRELGEPGVGSRRVYSGLSGTDYLHSDKRWDISPKSLEQLNTMVAEIVTEVHATADRLIELPMKQRHAATSHSGGLNRD